MNSPAPASEDQEAPNFDVLRFSVSDDLFYPEAAKLPGWKAFYQATTTSCTCGDPSCTRKAFQQVFGQNDPDDILSTMRVVAESFPDHERATLQGINEALTEKIRQDTAEIGLPQEAVGGFIDSLIEAAMRGPVDRGSIEKAVKNAVLGLSFSSQDSSDIPPDEEMRVSTSLVVEVAMFTPSPHSFRRALDAFGAYEAFEKYCTSEGMSTPDDMRKHFQMVMSGHKMSTVLKCLQKTPQVDMRNPSNLRDELCAIQAEDRLKAEAAGEKVPTFKERLRTALSIL